MKSNLQLVSQSDEALDVSHAYVHQKWMDRIPRLDQSEITSFLRDFSQQNPSIVEEVQVLKHLKEHHNLPLADLRKQLNSFKTTAAPDESMDHLDLCQEILESLGRENLLHIASTTYRWDAIGIWRIANEREIKGAIQTYAKERGVEVTASLVNSVADLLKSEIYLADSPFDSQREIKINCKSGTLVWAEEAWVLRAFERTDYFTSQIPVEYDAEATCDVFKRFMATCFQGDEDATGKAYVILQMLGYTLLRTCKFEKGILLVGNGANGKSVLLSLVEMLVGTNNIAGVQPASFDNRFQLGYLRGKLANVVTELPANGSVPDGVLKQIVSGELITAEHKNHPPFDFRPFCTLWVGTNHLPNTSDASDALYRRFLILSFNNQFPENDPRRDPNLKSKLEQELPGILNLALEALANLLKCGGFAIPTSSIKEARAWRHDQDPVVHFIDSACAKQPSEIVDFSDLYEHFVHFMNDEGHTNLMSKNALSRRLQKLGYQRTKGKNGQRKVSGLQIVEAFPL